MQGSVSSEDLVVLIRDLKLVATVWTLGKALFDLSFEVSSGTHAI